jgi:hypothetical protein
MAVGFRGSAGKRELPCRGTNDAGGNAKKSGFSGTITAGKDDAFTRRNLEGYAAKCEEAAVAFIDVFKPQTGWRQGQRSHKDCSGNDKAEIEIRNSSKLHGDPDPGKNHGLREKAREGGIKPPSRQEREEPAGHYKTEAMVTELGVASWLSP